MLDQSTLNNVPVLIVGNKVDVVAHMREPELIEREVKRAESGLPREKQVGSRHDISFDWRKLSAGY